MQSWSLSTKQTTKVNFPKAVQTVTHKADKKSKK